VERTVQAVLGATVALGVADERLLAYRSNISASVDGASAHGYLDFANSAATQASLDGCSGECVDWLLDDVGPLLFRRPLGAAEHERYTALFTLAREHVEAPEAARWVLEAMLQSPTFLYLDEVANADGLLDDYALAARLSLVLWGRNPDAVLLERARSGALRTDTGRAQEIARLLADPASEGGAREFVDQWFDLARLNDPDVRPDLTELGAETLAALRDEPVRFFMRLLADGAGLGELLTSTTTPASSALESLYASDIVQRSSDRFELDPARRGGILALPGVAAATSHARRSSPTLRGKAILTGLLCTPPEAPPANVNTTLPPVAAGVSTRERLQEHMTASQCRGCHAPMDGLGFTLERLDWLGRSRATDSGVTIDDVSTFPLGDAEVTLGGAPELAAALAVRPDVAACVARQWLRYSLGVTETHDADCLIEHLAQTLGGERGLERMIVESLGSDWFRRGPGESP